MYSWKVSFEVRGEVQTGLGLKTGSADDVLVALLLGTAAELVDWVTTGTGLPDLINLVEMDRLVVLDLTGVADLGLVEVRVDAGRVEVEVGKDPSSVGAAV